MTCSSAFFYQKKLQPRQELDAWTGALRAVISLKGTPINSSYISKVVGFGEFACLSMQHIRPNHSLALLPACVCSFSTQGPDATNCAYRATTALGSSKYWSQTMSGGTNVVSGNHSINPFASFTRVFIPYCSGDLFLGRRNATVSADFPYRFSGHLIVAAAVKELSKYFPGIYNASQVLLAGSSAGGIGTFQNADFVSSLLPGVKYFRAAPQVLPDVAMCV